MPTQTRVYVSREGSLLAPQTIRVDVALADGEHGPRLEGSMPLDGFLDELLDQMPHPTLTWTRAQLDSAVRDAAAAVVVKLKHEIARVM